MTLGCVPHRRSRARARRRVGTGGRIGAMRRRARRRARSALMRAFACASSCAFARAESSIASARMDDGIQHHGGDVSKVTTATATWDDRARGDAKGASSSTRESSLGDAMARKLREGSRRDDLKRSSSAGTNDASTAGTRARIRAMRAEGGRRYFMRTRRSCSRWIERRCWGGDIRVNIVRRTRRTRRTRTRKTRMNCRIPE